MVKQSAAEILSDQIITFVTLEKLTKELNDTPGFDADAAYDKMRGEDEEDVSPEALKNFCRTQGWALELDELKAVVE